MSHGLSEPRNVDGRPIWEPPILDYSHLIDTENGQPYTKRREAVLQHTGQDVARATAILDKHDESELLNDYIEWAKWNDAGTEDAHAKAFWQSLRDDLRDELLEVQDEGGGGWVRFEENEDGPWKMEQPQEWLYDDSDFDGAYDQDSDESGPESAQVPFSTSSSPRLNIEPPTPSSSQPSALQISASVGLHQLGLRQVSSCSSVQPALQILIPQTTKVETDLD